MVYLLFVVGGGVILTADTVFDYTVSTGDYTVPFGLLTGLAFVIAGVASLVGATNRRRIRAIGWAGLFVGFILTFVVYYAGIGLLILTGIGLFTVVFDSSSQPSAESA